MPPPDEQAATPTAAQILRQSIPDGKYELTERAHDLLLRCVHAPPSLAARTGEPAHPIFAHLATHCGMGWTFNDFLAHVGAVPADGVVFGGGTFTYHRPLVVGEAFTVRSAVREVRRKHGRRIGDFDAITIALELTGADGGTAVATTETYIVPRRTGSPPAPPAQAAQAPPAPAKQHPESHGYQVGPIRREDIAGVMEVMQDTNPIHLDAELAVASGYRGPVNQGPANLAYVFNAMATDRGQVDDLRFAAFTFHDTVTEGDRLEVQLTADDESAEGRLYITGTGLAVTCRAEFGPA